MSTRQLILCSALAVSAGWVVPLRAQDAAQNADPKQQVQALEQELGQLQGKAKARLHELQEQDPEIKALQGAIEARRKASAEADQALLAKVAEKDPEAKALVDQRNALAQRAAESDQLAEKLRKQVEDLRKQAEELRNQSRELQRELGKVAPQVEAKVRSHLRDEDLKALVEARAAKQQELRQAEQAPLAKALEKHPDLRELQQQQEALRTRLRELREASRPEPPRERPEAGKAGTEASTEVKANVTQ